VRITKGKRTYTQTVQRRARVMNREYLKAKVDLCLTQAEIDIQQQEIARAIKNLERANLALTRIFNLDEEEGNE
jgi:outer membrane protein TolC